MLTLLTIRAIAAVDYILCFKDMGRFASLEEDTLFLNFITYGKVEKRMYEMKWVLQKLKHHNGSQVDAAAAKRVLKCLGNLKSFG